MKAGRRRQVPLLSLFREVQALGQATAVCFVFQGICHIMGLPECFVLSVLAQ